MGEIVRKVERARDLSAQWNRLAEEYFQQQEFLIYNEMYNPCSQRYYELHVRGQLKAGAVLYSITLDLLMFAGIPSPYKFHIIGIPVSVCSAGLIGAAEDLYILLKHIFKTEKGTLLALNTSPALSPRQCICMPTLPSIRLTRCFTSLEDYTRTLRSGYRRHLLKVTRKLAQLSVKTGPCSLIQAAEYDLYLQVMARTTTKMETLSLDYFRNLPDNFLVTIYYYKNEPVTWHVALKDNAVLFFFFGGINYKLNNRFDAYFNNLIGIINKGALWKCRAIDFGSTAELPKLRLGGELVLKNMFVYHRNPVVRLLFRLAKPFLQYKPGGNRFNVFREEA